MASRKTTRPDDGLWLDLDHAGGQMVDQWGRTYGLYAARRALAEGRVDAGRLSAHGARFLATGRTDD
jgi:hypothetical protein